MHGVFPFDLATGTEILFQLHELAHHIAVVGLVNELGEKALARGDQFPREWRCVLDERGVQTFEDVRVGFEGHHEEFPEFPVGFLGVVVLDLLWHRRRGTIGIQRAAGKCHVGPRRSRRC
jgi:hypothetical protein